MFTTLNLSKYSRRNGRRHVIALALAACALAIPSSASAFYGSNSDDGSGSKADPIARNAGLVAPDHTSLNASLHSPATAQSDDSSPNGTVDQSPGYSSLNAISGAPAGEPTFVSGSPSSVDSFDWADAALGAGVAMALITLGGVALLTLRRRTAVSPTA